MATTTFLSMWISNTATAAMMLAIAHAVLRELEEESSITHSSGSMDSEEPPQSPVQIVYAKRYNEASGELREEVSVGLEREMEREEGERESLLEAQPAEGRQDGSESDDGETINSKRKGDMNELREGDNQVPIHLYRECPQF